MEVFLIQKIVQLQQLIVSQKEIEKYDTINKQQSLTEWNQLLLTFFMVNSEIATEKQKACHTIFVIEILSSKYCTKIFINVFSSQSLLGLYCLCSEMQILSKLLFTVLQTFVGHRWTV